MELAQDDLLEELVAPEQLVRALAGRDHGDPLLAHLAGEQVERDRAGAHERRLAVPDDVGERVRDVGRQRLDDVVARAERARDLLLVDALVVARVAERDRERAQLVLGLLLGERADQARVEAAGEVRADGNVGAQAQAHAVAEELLEVAVRLPLDAVLRRPPRPLLDDPPALPDDQPARPHLPHAARRPFAGPAGPRA